MKIITGAPIGLRRIDRWNLSERERAFRKALFISRLSSRLADATMDGTIGIHAFEKMEPEKKATLWDHAYEQAMKGFSTRAYIKNDSPLLKQITFLERYFSLPKKIQGARERHSEIIKKITTRLTKGNIDPQENHLLELERLARKAKIVPGE